MSGPKGSPPLIEAACRRVCGAFACPLGRTAFTGALHDVRTEIKFEIARAALGGIGVFYDIEREVAGRSATGAARDVGSSTHRRSSPERHGPKTLLARPTGRGDPVVAFRYERRVERPRPQAYLLDGIDDIVDRIDGLQPWKRAAARAKYRSA